MTFYLESCLLGLDEFLKHTCWVVGDGSRIILWLDLCCGEVPLSVQFPRHLSVVVGLNAKLMIIIRRLRGLGSLYLGGYC